MVCSSWNHLVNVNFTVVHALYYNAKLYGDPDLKLGLSNSFYNYDMLNHVHDDSATVEQFYLLYFYFYFSHILNVNMLSKTESCLVSLDIQFLD